MSSVECERAAGAGCRDVRVRGTGAARNPFMLDYTRPGARPWLVSSPDDATPESVLARLDEAGVGALVGPHGTGKSTLLVHLERILLASGRRVERVTAPGRDEHGRRPPRQASTAAVRAARAALGRLPPGGVLLLDSADRTSVLDRWGLVRAARRRGVRLLLVAHCELAVPTVHRRTVDATLARRLAAEMAAGEPGFPLPDRAWFEAALAQDDGNLRAAFGRLYDAFEQHDATIRASNLG